MHKLGAILYYINASDADDVLSKGYQLHIKAIWMKNISCMKPMVEKHGLKMKQEATF